MYEVYDFGSVKISGKEIEEMAIDVYVNKGQLQPARVMTEAFLVSQELFVSIASANGPIETLRVVAINDRVFLQALDEGGLEASQARNQGAENKSATDLLVQLAIQQCSDDYFLDERTLTASVVFVDGELFIDIDDVNGRLATYHAELCLLNQSW